MFQVFFHSFQSEKKNDNHHEFKQKKPFSGTSIPCDQFIVKLYIRIFAYFEIFSSTSLGKTHVTSFVMSNLRHVDMRKF